MNRQIKQDIYTAPEMEVMEIKTPQVICGSYDGNPANMGWGEDNGSNWQ